MWTAFDFGIPLIYIKLYCFKYFKENNSTCSIKGDTVKQSDTSSTDLNKLIRLTSYNKITTYDSDLDLLRNFTESSGTHSYDSPNSMKSLERHLAQGYQVNIS